MRGSIVKKGPTYYAVIAIGPKRKWIKGGKTQKDAERVLNENLNAVEEGTFQDIKKVTFREFSKIWINTHVNAHIKETARDEYQYVADRLVKHFEDVQLQAITGAHVQGFINKRMEEVQVSTARKNTIILKQMFKHAQAWGYIKRSPSSNIDNPKVTKKKVVILNIDDVSKVIDKIHPHYRVAVLTAVLTGLRANELWGLTWEDVDFSQLYLIPPSTKNDLRLNITNMTRMSL